MHTHQAVVLIGSPRGKSTSQELGRYLLEQLSAAGWETSLVHAYPALRSQNRWQALKDCVSGADLLILSLPLYVDTLPAGLIEVLERLTAEPALAGGGKQVMAFVNSGFPELAHSQIAVMNCEQFALEMGWQWMGGLILGAGMMVHGEDLVSLGGRTMALRTALDLVAKAALAGTNIPAEAQALISQPVIPHWLYRMMGGFGWLMQGYQNKILGRLWSRPKLVVAERSRKAVNKTGAETQRL